MRGSIAGGDGCRSRSPTSARIESLPTTRRVADREHLFAALRLLTPRERGVIALRYYEDLTEAETADVLGVAIGTVKSTTARALATLRAQPAMRDALARSTR
jgi:RNA polymerase sigma factor (sigma-70 family)